jgi:hypothetical protein
MCRLKAPLFSVLTQVVLESLLLRLNTREVLVLASGFLYSLAPLELYSNESEWLHSHGTIYSLRGLSKWPRDPFFWYVGDSYGHLCSTSPLQTRNDRWYFINDGLAYTYPHTILGFFHLGFDECKTQHVLHHLNAKVVLGILYFIALVRIHSICFR